VTAAPSQTLTGEPLEDRGIVLEAGKQYRTRNGQIVKVSWVIQRAESLSKQLLDHPAFCDLTDPKTGRNVDTSYAINGKWCIYKERLKNTTDAYDIVAEVVA
jgi:hypothetical protein